MLVPGRASRVILGAGFRHQDGKEEQPADRNGGEIEEADWIAEPLDDKACRQIAQTGTDADRQRDEPLRQIEPSGAAHEISRDDDRDDAEESGGYSVQQLDRHHGKGIGAKEGEQHAAQRQHPQHDQKNGLTPVSRIQRGTEPIGIHRLVLHYRGTARQ